MAVQCGYAEHRLRAARHGPWHLIHGDIRANLHKLQHGPKPKDVVSCKIRALVGLGLDPDSLVPGVQLLAEAPWSMKLVEQGHTLSSRLLRYHRYYTSETLRARTVVAATKPFVSPTAPKAKRNIEKVRGRLRKLRKSQLAKLGGRQVFLGALLRYARSRYAASEYHVEVRPKVVRAHSKLWKEKSREEQQEWAARARELHEEKSKQVHEQIASEDQSLRKLEQEERKEQWHGRCLRMSDCCWTEAQKIEFESLFASAEWTCDVISRLRASDATPVQEPDAATLALLRSMDYSMDCDEDVPSPVWLGWMCGHREFFGLLATDQFT